MVSFKSIDTIAIDASYQTAYDAFLRDSPEFKSTLQFDELRDKEFSALVQSDHVYLDYVGAHLYPISLVRQHASQITAQTFGNPHSDNPTSRRATEMADRSRAYVKTFFNDADDAYIVIFTANASGALKLVGESYPFDQHSHFLLSVDNHNSVNGIREFARRSGSGFTYAPLDKNTLQIDEHAFENLLRMPVAGHKLMAYPAQSNFSGVRHDLAWIARAQALGWDVLLDAAAFVPANKLDLSRHKPEFVSISFYKMFGYPTGIGCLLMKRSVLPKMVRPWFAGGTIEYVSVGADVHKLSGYEAGFEDGTINFLNIPAVENGLRYLNALGMNHIIRRTTSLAQWTLHQLLGLQHRNGNPVVQVYGTTDPKHRGATVTFNVLDETGKVIFYEDVEAAASLRNISVRTGCFCNPGSSETANEMTKDHIQPVLDQLEEFSYAELTGLMKDHFTIGAVRISFGYISSFADAYKVVEWLRSYQC